MVKSEHLTTEDVEFTRTFSDDSPEAYPAGWKETTA